MKNKYYPKGFEGRIQLADAVPLKTPLLIQVEPSGFCNLRCPYCIHGTKEKNHSWLMGIELFTYICRDIKKFPDKIKQFNFCGWGEPLLNPRLPEMVTKIKKTGQVGNIAVVTNGTLLHPDISRKLISAGIDNLRISLQGLDNESYEKIAKGKKGLFDLLMDNVANFYSASRGKCELSVKFAQPEITKAQEKKFHDLFDKISDRTYIEYIKPVFTKAKENMVSRYGVKHSPILICPQPFYMIDISAQGNIYPCCSFFNPLGNNFDTSLYLTKLKEYWDSQSLRDLQNMLLSKQRKSQQMYPECAKCNIPGANIGPGDNLDRKVNIIKKRMKIS